MSPHENRMLTRMNKWVNLWWWIAVIGAPVMLLVLLVLIFATGRLPLPARVSVYLDFYGARLLGHMPEGAVEASARVTLARAVYSLAVVEAPAIIIAVYQLKKILENVARKTPFVIENAVRIRILGLTVIGSACLRFGRAMILSQVVVDVVRLKELSLTVQPAFNEMNTAFYGFLILILAEIFRYGIRLQEEADLTV